MEITAATQGLGLHQRGSTKWSTTTLATNHIPTPLNQPAHPHLALQENDSIRRGKRSTEMSASTMAQNFHKHTKGTFIRLRQEAEQNRRSTRILIQAMKTNSSMQETHVGRVSFQADIFIRDIAKDYAHFAEEKTVHEFIRDRLSRTDQETTTFLNNKNLINLRISDRPNATDRDLIDYAQSLLTIPVEAPPINASEPFVQYLDELLGELDWIDWGKASQNIKTPLQAIHALYIYHYDRDMAKMDGLALGERIAKGETPLNIMQQMSTTRKIQLDQAALLFTLSTTPNYQLQEKPRNAMALGKQLAILRDAFLLRLRDEWLISQLFLPNTARDNVFFDQNALRHAQGKTVTDLAASPQVTSLPGMNKLHPQFIEGLVKQKLDRLGESTEYKFGTLQHGMATILKRSWLLQGKTPPSSFGTEAQMAEAFITLCHRWETKQSPMLNPKLMLAQYCAQASGEEVMLGAETTQQRISALQTYLAERWLANYGELPKRFDRREAALNILKTAVGHAVPEHELTEVKKEFNRVERGSMVSRHFLTPLEYFIYLADHPGPIDNAMMVAHKIFVPRAQLQQAEENYNQTLPTCSWIKARIKENIRISGGTLNTSTLNTEQQKIINHYHVETESERDWHSILRVIKNQPIISNIWRFSEGIYNGDAEEIIGAIPVVGNIYELEEGIRHGDAERAISAIPIIGSGYQFEEALRKGGDSLQVILSGEAFIFDIVTVGELPKVGRARLSVAEHTVLKEGELSPSHTIGFRNYMVLSKSLNIPLKGVEHLETTPSENFQHTRAVMSPGDPYNIESLVTRPELPSQVTSTAPSSMTFGPEMDKYRVPQPREGLLANEHGIYIVENARYIKSGEHYYPVRYDADNSTWRVYFPENLAKPAVPVKRQSDGSWHIHNDVGLKGGGLTRIVRPTQGHMTRLFNNEMVNTDIYTNARKSVIENYYDNLQHSRKRYEQSFDVEGKLAVHKKPAEIYPNTGEPYFDIRTHGDPNKVLSITGRAVGPVEFANEIKRYVKYYPPGTPIRLLACETARGGVRSFAQRFANAMNVPVKAYTTEVRVSDSAVKLERHAKIFLPLNTASSRLRWS